MPLSKDHYLNLKNGKFHSTSYADLQRLFGNLSSHPNRATMVVHFHGGLVGEKAGMAVAENLSPVYEKAGGYPVFFVWESGFTEVLSHNFIEVLSGNLDQIFKEKIFQLLLKKVTQFAVGKLTQPAGTRGTGQLELPAEASVQRELSKLEAGGSPYATLDGITIAGDETLREMEEQQFSDDIETDPDIEEEANRIAESFLSADDIAAEHDATRGARVHGASRTLMSPAVIEEIRSGAQARGQTRGLVTFSFVVKHTVTTLRRVITRFAKKRAHGVYATIAEEILREFYVSNIGAFVWSQMKQDTEDAFQDDPKVFGGTAFLEGIRAGWEKGVRPRIILAGHSTGAVYICHFLRYAEERLPPGIKFDVVFLAPACTFSLLSDTLQTSAGRLNDIRIFTMKDPLEKANHLVPLLYPHSLLYFISGILEDESDKPIVGMQRFYSGAPPFDAAAFPDIDRVRTYVIQNPARAVWSEEHTGPGRESASARHTDFDEDPATLGSLQHIIRLGL